MISPSIADDILVPTERIIEEAREGRMFILVDEEDRENEGDLVIPAQMATPSAINFMAAHGRGLICLAMARERIEQLGLSMMSAKNGTRHETAFTVSIEAREGVTTGISAADRARTISVAIDGSKDRSHIVSPGHVFPLMARDGGVLVRAGHTEAAVDIARLAGLNPSGVICEIMKDDGSMARLDDLVVFARTHGLKIGTIRDLIAYRRRHDHLVRCTANTVFHSHHGGEWIAKTFSNKADGVEHLVLQKGTIDPSRPTLVRMHALSLLWDTLGEVGGPQTRLHHAMEAVAEAGSGVIVVLRDTSAAAVSEVLLQRASGQGDRLRDYGIGAQILVELGVGKMALLTNSTQRTIVGLDAYDLDVVAHVPFATPALAKERA